jgi:ribonuclease G
MSKEIFISSTPHETRLAIVEDEALTEIYYERENEYTLAGSIYNGRVTRVLPGMQSSFVEIGLERDAFLYITDFMEEAPDSEEFDTTPAGDLAVRAPRLGNGEQAGDSGGRGDAGGRGGERGGRGRRGGRDRDRNQDRNAERQGGPDAAPLQQDGGRGEAGINDADSAAPREFNEGSEIGEGAAGADGSRRWRGRRGRRRGRGASGQAGDTTGQAGDATQENSAAGYPAAQGYSEVPGDGDDDSTFERESTHEIDGEAGLQPPAPSADRGPESPRSSDSARDNSPRSARSGDRGRRDGGRTRDGQRRDGQRQDQRPQRFPRGFEPSRNLYGVDSGETSGTGPIANAYPDEIEAGAEPIILPGESLSKYRKGGEEQAAAAPTQATPVNLAPPANLYTLAAGWDGGATLPGETLSRRSPSESRPDARHDSRSDSREGRNRSSRDFERGPRRDSRPDRNDRNRNDRSEGRHDHRNDAPIGDAAAAAAIFQQGFQPSTPAAEIVQESERPNVAGAHVVELHESPEAATPGTPGPEPEAVAAPESAVAVAPEAAPQVEVEYEPEDASASYRVDPVPPSEFRQSAPIVEPEPEAQAKPPAEVAAEPVAPAPEAHEITSITPVGQMLSESAEVLPVEAQESVPQGLKPHHEQRADGTAEAVPLSGTAAGFAPGHGLLAEEVLDADDAPVPSIHASSIEEIEDLDEEETVEGAADLGTMLREMSIDQITRATPEVEDEDDLDEDEDFEEDDLDEEELDEEDEEEEDDEEGQEQEEHGDSAQADDLDEQTARSGNAADAEFYEAQSGQPEEANRTAEQTGAAAPRPDRGRDFDRRPGRRDGRRDGRRGRGDRGDRPRSTGGERTRFGHGGGRGRASMQSTNLPAISDLLKPGQEILVQIAKEPIAKKGARITSHIALPGRFLVFMPTVNHIGVSRKIESDAERRRLKEILLSEKGDASGGFIVRTAAEGASEEELRSDLRFLLNLWADIKARSESSKSPALIYHDLNLIERILRDQVTDSFSAIWVDSENEYERVLRFLQRFQPSLIRRVKLYLKDTPLFEQFGITEEINKALRSKVWLKSGGSIVINQTEALVAIDINTGKYVGKTARLEDTIVKTNLDAIPEIVRQIRLRDLGGIIIIDFIDMDERKNRNRVMAALEDELKLDRAPSKVLQFNDFGLVAITRKRVKQSLERTLSTTCAICEGTGMVKSPITVCNEIFIEMRKMHKTLERGDIMLRVHPEVVKQLKASGAKWLLEMEEMAGKTILVKSDPALHPEQFDIH